MMRGGSGRRPWRWWRAKCAGIAASVGSRLRRSIKGLDGRRRRRRATTSYAHHRQHYRSFAPVYVDELYNHHHVQPIISKPLIKLDAVVAQEEPATKPSTSGAAPATITAAAGGVTGRASGKATARVAAAATNSNGVGGVRAAGGKQPQARAAAAAGVGAMKNILMRSPGRGGGVLGVVKGMGEVDLRAELFIRKFKEDMRLQSQRSAEEFQAMLARGL
ncbi:hypothetical protein EJB05_10011, partial [Eragrostis curvula]